MTVFLIPAALLGLFAVLAGLIALRVRAIAWGLFSFLAFYTFIAVTLRSHVTGRMDGFAVATLRTVNTAEITYLAEASKFGSIEDLIRAGVIEQLLHVRGG